MLKPYKKAEITFEYIHEIGHDGRNSNTYLARDHQLDAEIVIKRIGKDKFNSPDLFFSESRLLYASAHEHVVELHYACHDDDSIYLAMPYYRNGSVKGLITGRYLTVREIITIGTHVLAGLHNIHSKGLIHFDVKPDNILLSSRGDALLSDFGQAKQMNFIGVAVQNRHYSPMIPPEATLTNDFQRTFDIYQFGLTIYRMCNGNEHFYRQFQKYCPSTGFDRAAFQDDVRNGRFPDRKDFAPHIPTTLRNVIKKCLDPDPAQRYQSALDVANALSGIDGNCLDWRLEQHRDKLVWRKNENGTNYELTLENGNVTCYKAVNGGQARRVKDGCLTNVSDRDLRKLFTGY